MARKKKIDFGFEPSEYQKKIFEFVEHGVGNAVVSAYAGTGKTSTIVAATKLIPKKLKCLFLAFNKSVAEELSEKLKSLPNVQVRTSHSLGFLMLRKNFGNEIEVNEYKYRSYIKSHLSTLSTASDLISSKEELNEYIETITALVNFSRFNHCQSIKEIEEIAKKYTIPTKFDECEVTLKVLKWGKKTPTVVDYTDMVWLPVELALKPLGLQFDWVMVDECQDQSVISIELFKKCFKRGTRFIGIGDQSQMIYCFSGASEKAFETICSLPNTTIFELPVSYRCDRSIIKIAKQFVPKIVSRETADEGKICRDCHITDLQGNDMVLARTKAPLVKLYTRLLRRKVNCFIKGQDIASNLLKILEKINVENLSADLKSDGVFVRLYDKLFKDRDKLMNQRGLDYDDATLSNPIMEEYDNINTLNTLAVGLTTKEQLINHIETIFKEKEEGICLSTIHKAKGLESDNVYILCHSTMPSKLAHYDWEKRQEQNLIYVAYTRAKHKLGFISEKEIPPCGSTQEPMNIINDLMYIENKISSITGKEPTVRMSNVDIAKFSLMNATKIEENENIPKEINVLKNNKSNKSFLERLDDLEAKYKGS